MTQTRRSAPDPEWEQMYRSGIPTPKIAAAAGAAETTVRYHLAIAARQNAGLRAEHHAALSTPQRVTAPGQQNLDDVLTFYEAEGRWPAKGRTDRERALAAWLHRRRKDAAEGTLAPVYAQALDTIPGWRDHPPDAVPTRTDGSSASPRWQRT